MPITDVSNILRPRRGSAGTMSTTKKDTVLAAGELFVEYQGTAGVGKGPVRIKIGDGTTTYENLPYAISNEASSEIITYTDDTSETVAGAIANAASGRSIAQIVAGLKQAISLVNTSYTGHAADTDIHITSTERTNWNSIYNNGITAMTVDGNSITVSNNAVSFDTPDYTLVTSAVSSAGNVRINLTPEAGYNKVESTIQVSGDDAIHVSTSSTDGYSITHNNSGITAGTYKSVTVNAFGHVTEGSNPTTLAGYGITDAQTTITGAATTITDNDLTASKALISSSAGKVAASDVTSTELSYLSGTTASVQTQLNGKAPTAHSHDNSEIISVDASKITTGTIDIARLPHGALERVIVVADDTARFALTKADAQNGDVVKVESTLQMYFIVDDDHLDTEAGYEVFKAGTATSVPWAGVTDKPSTFPPSAHTHTMSEITDLYGIFGGATSAANGSVGFVPAPSAGDEAKYLAGDGTWTAFTLATTAAQGLMSAEDKQAVEIVKDGDWDFGDEG